MSRIRLLKSFEYTTTFVVCFLPNIEVNNFASSGLYAIFDKLTVVQYEMVRETNFDFALIKKLN